MPYVRRIREDACSGRRGDVKGSEEAVPETIGGEFLASLQSIFTESYVKTEALERTKRAKKHKFTFMKGSVTRHLRTIKRLGVTKAGASDPIKLPDGTEPTAQMIRPPAKLRELLTDKLIQRLDNAKDSPTFIKLLDDALNPKKRARQRKKRPADAGTSEPAYARQDHAAGDGNVKTEQTAMEVDAGHTFTAGVDAHQYTSPDAGDTNISEAQYTEMLFLADMIRTPYYDEEQEEEEEEEEKWKDNDKEDEFEEEEEEHGSESMDVGHRKLVLSVENSFENLPTTSIEDNQRIDLLYSTFGALEQEISLVSHGNWKTYERQLVSLLVDPGLKKMDFSKRLNRIREIVYFPEELAAASEGNWRKLRALAKICATVSERMVVLLGSNLQGLADGWLRGMNRDIDFLEQAASRRLDDGMKRGS